jgi:hypothetical protein
MTRRLSALLIPLALAGCATSSRVSADEGLRARLGRSPDGVRVALSEPAYVAVFEVVPGRRVELRYPAEESDPSLLPAGRTTLEAGGQRIDPYRGSASGRRTPFLYMIASRHPLDPALIRDMQQPWGVLDSDEFRSDQPTKTIERLTSLVVPANQPEADWADHVLLARRPERYYYEGPGGPYASSPGNTADRRICDDYRTSYGCLTPAQEQGRRQQGHKRPGRP